MPKCRTYGEPPKKPAHPDLGRLTITLRLPIPLKRSLEKEADRKAVTLHDLILFTLWAV